jgi:hypothetical protein
MTPSSTKNTAGSFGFRYENSPAIGSDSLPKPVSLVGPKNDKHIGVLIPSWWEIDDNDNEVSNCYVNGALLQSAT